MPRRSPRKRKSSVTRKKKKSISRDKKSSGRKYGLFLLFGLLALTVYVIYLDVVIRHQFEGKRWALPAKVYARPLELYPGMSLGQTQFLYELKRLNYRLAQQSMEAGSYVQRGDAFYLLTRGFQFGDGVEDSRYLRIEFDQARIDSIEDAQSRQPLDILRLEPAIIARIYPAHHEDRLLVKLDEVPTLLIKGLLALEDRRFFEHQGINPQAIARAFIANIRARSVVQGGSTLTQQLVKNFFLSNQRTVWRKLNEAVMSLLLEWHYDKDEILEAYLNEIYLGQDGSRAIHGVGLASRFYFDKAISQLDLAQAATLIALVRGPSYYDPWRNPQRLIARRNLVLSIMAEQNIITDITAKNVQGHPLNVVPRPSSASEANPAYIELVRHQLRRDYRPSDLSAEGLQIFTSFDPWIQRRVEQSLDQRIEQLDRVYQLDGQLEGAAIITNAVNGEVLALAGGRDPHFAGFNRAINASRPIGSLIKPAVYLTALQQRKGFTLATLLDDSGLSLKSEGGSIWTPQNYDGKSHGQVPLVMALINSYNQATVRLGMQLGFESIMDTLQRMGIKQEINPYPSMLLGAVNLTPYEVTRMYQTLASGGFNMPLRAVREVLSVDGTPLSRFPLNVTQSFSSESIQLMNSALLGVSRDGTARSLQSLLPSSLQVAGKTGTTNDLRDSWFAGYSASHLGVVWLGRDDNTSIGMTGSSGALKVWADIFRELDTHSLELQSLDSLEYRWVDKHNGHLTDQGCGNALYLPFYKGTTPQESTGCGVF